MEIKEQIERDIADLEADIMQTEEMMAEEEQDLQRLTSPDYKSESNPDDEFRDQDIMECQDAIAGYQRNIAGYQRKIEMLKARLTSVAKVGE